MSRSSAAFDDAPANDWSSEAPTASMKQPSWAEDKNPTRPLPVFVLEKEARRLDEEAEKAAAKEAEKAAAMRCDEDATVTVSAEENAKLLASLRPAAPYDTTANEPWNNDDEPTLDAPAPSSPLVTAILAARPVRVTARPPALKMLVITKPPPPPHMPRSTPVPAAPLVDVPASAATLAAAPVSGFHSKVPSELADTAREARSAEDPRRSAATVQLRIPKPDTTTYVVAGIWAMALSLLAVLMFMVTSA